VFESPRPKFLHLALFPAAYLLGSWLGHWLTLLPGSGVTLWPPSGLYLAVLLLSEKRHWPWWILAGLPAEAAGDLWLFHIPLSAAFSIYLGNTLEALVGASLVRGWCGAPFQLRGLREVLVLILFGALLSPVLSATLGAAILAALGWQAFTWVWPLWWVGDGVGVLIVAPLVLEVFQARWKWRDIQVARWVEAGTMIAVFVAIAHLVFTGRFPYGYIIMLPLLWATLRFEIFGMALTMAILTVMAVRYTAGGLGLFANPDFAPDERQWLVQMFLVIVAFSALVVAALTRQHRQALFSLERAYGELEARVLERTAEARENEERLRLFIEYAPAAVAMFDREMRYLAVSRRWLDDYSLEGEVRGRSHYDVFPEIPERWRNAHRRALAGEVVTADEDHFVRTNGTVQWQRWEVRPWRGADGAIGGIILFTEDITDRKVAENAVRESEEKYRALFESIDQGFCTIEVLFDENEKPVDYRFLTVNPAFERQTGIPNAAGRRMREIAPLHEEHWFEIYGRIALTGEPMRFENRAAQLHRYYDVYAFRIGAPEERKVAILFNDITERKRADEALRASEQRFRAIFEHAGTGIAITDEEGHVLKCNPAFCTLLGYTQEELGHLVLPDLVHPDDCAANFSALRRLREEELPYFEMENRYLRKDGQTVWVRKFVSLLRESTDAPAHLVALVTDMTERHHMEEALRAADRQKDEFLAMLAHELRNPLAPIRNALYVLQRSDAEAVANERTRAMLTMMERQVNHLVRLVDDLLEVSRITRGKIELKKERVDLAVVIGHAVETNQPLIQANDHDLSVSLPPEPLLLDADPVRIAQIFANLLNNATKYTPAGGHIHLTAAQMGNEAVVRVRDTGVGISAGMLPHVFDLFTQVDRTLDRSQGGLGIGLALVRRLVELHGGRVEVHSEGSGRGSEFVVYLPLAAAASADAAISEAAVP
jgi:PAS domain S-box-containing protein